MLHHLRADQRIAQELQPVVGVAARRLGAVGVVRQRLEQEGTTPQPHPKPYLKRVQLIGLLIGDVRWCHLNARRLAI
ncbi:MAG: hypothetical protein PVSMB4_02030 [Ktedonobacterales bacterium]